MFGIQGGPVVNLANSWGSILVFDNFYFLTQFSNFSISDNKGSSI